MSHALTLFGKIIIKYYSFKILKAHLQEKNIQNPAKAEELAAVLRKFYVEVRTRLNAFCFFRALEIF